MPGEKEQEALGAGEAAQLMPDDASVEPVPPGADGLVRQPTTDGGKARRKALQARMQPDEYAMTVGIVNIMVTSFVVGRAPESFFIVHLIKTAVLLPWRFFSWRPWRRKSAKLLACTSARRSPITASSPIRPSGPATGKKEC